MRLLGSILGALALLTQAHGADIAVALTDDLVEVDADFAGARLTLFGAVTGVDNPADTIDVIAVIQGPPTRFAVRRIERRNFIWRPGDRHFVDSAPGLYLTASTRPITDIAPLPDQAAYNLGTDFLAFNAVSPGESSEESDHSRMFVDAFITEVENKGLYLDQVGGVSFKKGALFAINADLPATTPVGEYEVSVYLYRHGELLGHDAARLFVNKVGIERRIYDLAHQQPVTYGVLCIVLSLLGGWAASLAFRK